VILPAAADAAGSVALVVQGVNFKSSVGGQFHIVSDTTVRGSLEEAKALRAELLADLSRGAYVGRSDQRLSDYLTSWLEAKKGTVADRTYERYSCIVKTSIIPALGRVRASALSPQHLVGYYASSRDEESRRRPGHTLSPTTIHHRHTVLKTALRQAVRDGVLSRNPADRVDPPKRGTRQLQAIDEAAAQKLIAGFEGSNLEMLVWLALNTGARLGELLALRWSDLDTQRQVVHVSRTVVEHMTKTGSEKWFDFKEPKNGKGRAVEIDAETVKRLRAHKRAQSQQRLTFGIAWADHDLAFPNVTNLRSVNPGEPTRPSSISRTFRHRVEGLGLPGIRFHDLRHAHATMLLRQGFPAHLVSRRLGHSDVAITLRVYAGVLPGQERAMVDAFAASLAKAAQEQ
jgi:integrase